MSEIILLKPPRFSDNRGWFSETYRADYRRLPVFVQDNHSCSRKNVIRGMHYQPGMSKLMRVTRGAAFLAAVNLRTGETFTATVGEQDGLQIWAPDHWARGFCALTDNTEIQYKCSAFFDPKTEGAVRWDSVGIKWPVDEPILSEKDRRAAPLRVPV